MVGERILGIVAVGIHHYIKSFRDIILVGSKGAYPAVLGERGSYPHLLALVHEEMLLHVAVIIIRGIFAREQSCLIGLLLLYLSILEIGGKGAGKLALGIILPVEDHEAAFALQFAAHIVGAELLGCRRISRIECQAIIVGESLVRGYLPALVVIEGVQPVLRNGRSFWHDFLLRQGCLSSEEGNHHDDDRILIFHHNYYVFKYLRIYLSISFYRVCPPLHSRFHRKGDRNGTYCQPPR